MRLFSGREARLGPKGLLEAFLTQYQISVLSQGPCAYRIVGLLSTKSEGPLNKLRGLGFCGV